MTPTIFHPLADLMARRGTVVIDGAMSTALEALGADLNDSLWTAKVLLEKPELITEVHRRYYEAGADVAITASYQATPAGFAEKGVDEARARELIALTAKLAVEARDEAAARHPERAADLLAPSVPTAPISRTGANTAATTASRTKSSPSSTAPASRRSLRAGSTSSPSKHSRSSRKFLSRSTKSNASGRPPG